MKTRISFNKLEAKKDNNPIIEIVMPQTDKIDHTHIFKITRPEVNEERIRQIVSNKWREEMTKWLFSKEVRAEMENECKMAIEDENKRIENMPNPIIFLWNLKKIEHKNRESIIQIYVPYNIAIYFLNTRSKLSEMLLELDNVPLFLDNEKKNESIIDIFEKFSKENKDVYEDISHRNPYKKLIDNSSTKKLKK